MSYHGAERLRPGHKAVKPRAMRLRDWLNILAELWPAAAFAVLAVAAAVLTP